MAKTIFLAYDLSSSGDYEALYEWLDAKGAEECGDSIARIKFADDDKTMNVFIKDLKQELEERIALTPKDRFYVIVNDTSGDAVKETRSGFLIGKRKHAPWVGYAPTNEKVEDVLGV